jgi:uncharacterized membrane protein
MKTSSRNALVFFIAIGTILRLWQIGFQTPWLEESYTLGVASLADPSVIINYVTAADCNTPTYYLLAHFSLLIFGGWFGDAVAARIPSLVAGVLFIPAMYLLGREYKDELTGVFCSGLVSILFPFVYYSQYARAYSLSFLCFAITLIFFIRTYRHSTTTSEHVFWILAGINVWIHLFAIVPAGILCLVLLVQKLRARMAYALLPAVICLPIGQMFLQVGKTRTIAAGDFGLDPLMLVLTTPGEFFGVLFVIIGMLVAIYLLLEKDSLKWRLMSVVTGTIIVGVWLSQFTPFFPRYYMTVALILVLMAGVVLSEMIKMIPLRFEPELIPVVVILILLALQCQDFYTYYTIQKYASAPPFLPQLF